MIVRMRLHTRDFDALITESSDLPASELQRVLDRIAAGALELLPVHTYSLEDIVDAQRDMASGARQGKLVGLPWD